MSCDWSEVEDYRTKMKSVFVNSKKKQLRGLKSEF